MTALPEPVSESDRLRRLAARAAEAAAIRAHQTDPDVIALRVERVRSQVDALLWVAIVAGLGFTMVNVQQFAAAGANPGSLAWLTAWLLDPMVSLVLVAVLVAEQVTARYQVSLPGWARITKWFTFAATYTMNTWQSWAHHSPSGVVLHSVPPLVVFAAAETGPGLRDRLTEAVARAIADAHSRAAQLNPHPGLSSPSRPTPSTAAAPAAHGATRSTRPARRRRRTEPAPRRLATDYLAQARAALTPGIEPTAAWCREITGCGKTVSVQLAKTLRAERDQHQSTAAEPDGSVADLTDHAPTEPNTNQEEAA